MSPLIRKEVRRYRMKEFTMESNHLNKPVHRSKRKQKCKSDNKHNEQLNDKQEYIKSNIKIIKCGDGK